jgi:hypothetical protein
MDKGLRAVILNSRQNSRPAGSNAWIINTRRAVEDAIACKYTILTSVGMSSWEFVLYFAAPHCNPLEIFLPLEKGENMAEKKSYYIKQFMLFEDSVSWHFIEMDRRGGPYFQEQRDRQIIQKADVIYPVSLRPGGNLEALIAENPQKAINDSFRMEYCRSQTRCKLTLEAAEINPAIDNAVSGYLIHWTRTANDKWPGERWHDYYKAIAESDSDYPRSGLDTLNRILSDRKLRGSSRHYRRGMSAVAFSLLAPSEALQLMKWRARYQEMTFEPYGIAIRADEAERFGIKKVFYGNSEMYDYLDDKDKPYFQSLGTKGFWFPEKEYRHLGDLDFSLADAKDLKVIVRKENEVEWIPEEYRRQAIAFQR